MSANEGAAAVAGFQEISAIEQRDELRMDGVDDEEGTPGGCKEASDSGRSRPRGEREEERNNTELSEMRRKGQAKDQALPLKTGERSEGE